MGDDRQTALIATNDEYYQMALELMLTTNLKFNNIICANSLDDALERIAQESCISLAIFESTVPGVKGAACLMAVRECCPDVRLVMLSASCQKYDILTALDVGIHGFIPKDTRPAQLTGALQRVMSGEIYVPPSIANISPASDGVHVLRAEPLGRPTVDTLSPRQKEVLALLVQGKSNKEIARDLKLGEGTIKIHIAALFRAFGARTRAAVAAAGSQILSN